MRRPKRLFHFTCSHAAERIGKRGLLYPHPHPLLPAMPSLVWLTNQGSPKREAVGLTSGILMCDRMAFRYATSQECEWWPEFSEGFDIDAQVRKDLETLSDPACWFISTVPVKARLA